MRETLYILGIAPWAHWTSWLVSAVLPFFVVAVTVTSILAMNVLKFSNPFLLFLLIGLFLLSTIGFCFCIAALFSNAKLSSIVGPMAFFVTILRKLFFSMKVRLFSHVMHSFENRVGRLTLSCCCIVLSSTFSFLWVQSIRGCNRKKVRFAISRDGIFFWLRHCR